MYEKLVILSSFLIPPTRKREEWKEIEVAKPVSINEKLFTMFNVYDWIKDSDPSHFPAHPFLDTDQPEKVEMLKLEIYK